MNHEQVARELQSGIRTPMGHWEQLRQASNLDFAAAVDRFLYVVRDLILQVNQLEADGKTKKEAVIIVANRFYDELIAPMDLPGVPNFIEGRFVDPAVARIWESVVSSIVDHFVDLMRSPASLTGSEVPNP